MKNPPRKPKVPKGRAAHWIAPYSYTRIAYKKKDRLGKLRSFYKKVHVGGHYRIFKAPEPAPTRRHRVVRLKGWELANEFEARYIQEYDASNVDSIYRYNRATDVVRLQDGLVWDRPVKANVEGDFVMARVWYVVYHETQDQYFIYVRSFALATSLPSLETAALERTGWEGNILSEYEGKEYMSVQDFIAWTVFDYRERKPKRLHAFRKRGETRDRAFTTSLKHPRRRPLELKTRSGKIRQAKYETRRVLTKWEIKQALSGAFGAKIGLKRRKGESIDSAIKRMEPSEKRRYRRALMEAVRALERKWTKERRREK